VDRIGYNEERLADPALDRSDRAIALKFLVHRIGDVHQPFHVVGVARGGIEIPVSSFGSTACHREDGNPYVCHLHGVWDTVLIGHRGLSDQVYVEDLERQITQGGWEARTAGSPAEWAMESQASAKGALLPPRSDVDDVYFRAQIAVADERLALAGLRLAARLNQILAQPPPTR
jgi:hypothetical protein